MEITIALFSDTHNKHDQFKLPKCDIAIFSGDFSGRGNRLELGNFLQWYSNQDAKYKIMIAGNHDICFDPKYNEETHAQNWLPGKLKNYPDIIYLENSSTEVLGLKIWGSPITPDFNPKRWAFNRHRGDDIDQVWREIPFGTDIVVTHGPAAYILDYVEQDKAYAGDENLRHRIEEIKPKLHVFGHIHLESGKIGNKVELYKDTTYVNASVLNNRYDRIAEPVVVTINEDGIVQVQE